jgi:hypothetical protein
MVLEDSKPNTLRMIKLPVKDADIRASMSSNAIALQKGDNRTTHFNADNPYIAVTGDRVAAMDMEVGSWRMEVEREMPYRAIARQKRVVKGSPSESSIPSADADLFRTPADT